MKSENLPAIPESYRAGASTIPPTILDADYEPQAAALSAYFLMSLPPAIPDRAVRKDWRVGISDRDEAPFAVSDPFKDPK